MFSRLNRHRRTPSNPTSPLPDQTHSWDSSLPPTIEHAHPTRPPPGPPLYDSIPPQTSISASSSGPPSLPPISRVSALYTGGYDFTSEASLSQFKPNNPRDTQDRWNSRPNQNYPPPPQTQQWSQQAPNRRPDTAGAASSGSTFPVDTRPPPTSSRPQTTREKANNEAPLPFVTASDLQASGRSSGNRISPPNPPAVLASDVDSGKGKTRLNLLKNPMSLLARRRTGQAIPYLAPPPSAQSISQGTIESTYQPIRGTVFHDFGAPKPRRNVSYNDVQNADTGDTGISKKNQNAQIGGLGGLGIRIVPEEKNRWSGGNHVSPFTEDFDEEQYPAAGPHVRKANDFSDLALPRAPYARETPQRRPNTAQPAINSQTLSIPPEQLPKVKSPRRSSVRREDPPTPGPPVPPKGNEDVTTSRPATDRTSSRTSFEASALNSSPLSQGSRKGRPRNVSSSSTKEFSLSGIPKHMKSTSSRFSFDMIGAASQEKLLEDRHRQKALEKSASPDGRVQDEEEEDDYDYDNMMDDDGLEEEIPMMNADLYDDGQYEEPIPGMEDEDDNLNSTIHDFEEEPVPALDDDQDESTVARHSNGMSGFTFHPMSVSAATSPNDAHRPEVLTTPRDAHGQVIGFAMTKESPMIAMHQSPLASAPLESPIDPEYKVPMQNMNAHISSGLGLQRFDVGRNDQEKILESNVHGDVEPNLLSSHTGDDDMYFDDGMIDDLDESDDRQEFDESVFDIEDTDEYGRPLRPLSSLPTLYSPPYVRDSVQQDYEKRASEQSSRTSGGFVERGKTVSPSVQPLEAGPTLQGRKSAVDQYGIPLPQEESRLSQDSVSAYQATLAATINDAAANGRFRRDSNPQVHFPDEFPVAESSAKQFDSDLPLALDDYDQDDFDYDDALEDDDIVAEANREALANDSDGFYGQEFGFYSSPSMNGETQFGGYFAPNGANGLQRSQSGRVAGREPNLTPITERSEYSNRNSFLSLPLSGMSGMGQMGANGLNSPNLAQLASMNNEEFEDTAMSALMRFRRGWGGSQASLVSSHGSPVTGAGEENSPVNQLSPWGQAGNPFAHARKNSTFSLASDVPSHVSEEDESEIETSAPTSPTLTMGTASRSEKEGSLLPPSSPIKKSFGNTTTTTTTNLSLANLAKNGLVDVNVSKIDVPMPSSNLVDRLQNRPISPTVKSPTSLKSPIIGGGGGGGVVKKHRHTGSADSISYMKEDDPVAGERWVLERRRTGESGEVEILGREVVKGGRI